MNLHPSLLFINHFLSLPQLFSSYAWGENGIQTYFGTARSPWVCREPKRRFVNKLPYSHWSVPSLVSQPQNCWFFSNIPKLIEFFMGFSQRHSTLHFVSVLCCNLSAAVPVSVVFLEAGICGIVVPLSPFSQAAAELTCGSAPGGVVTQRWHQEPTAKWQLLAPTPASGSPRLLRNGYSHMKACQPIHLQEAKPTSKLYFFLLCLSLEQLVKIQAAFNSCTVKHKHRQASANTQLQTEIIPTQIACHSSAAHTEFENSCKQKETWHLTGKNNFLSWF